MNSPADKTNRASTATHQLSRRADLFRSPEQGSFFQPAKPFIQPRLEVSKPDDPHEREAEQTADRVMRMPEPAPAPAAPPPAGAPPEKLQRLDEHEHEEQEEIQAKRDPAAPAIQSSAEPDEHPVQAQAGSAAAPSAPERKEEASPLPHSTLSRLVQRRHISLFPSDVVQRAGRGPPGHGASFETQLTQTRGTGQELPSTTRSFMESRFQSDFSGVRIHTGGTAQALSKSIHAQAFTHGGDIYFNSGKFDPDSTAGRTLLAHELTHTVQQGASPGLAPASGNSPPAASVSRSVASRRTIQRQAAVPQLAAAVAKAKAEEGKVNADKPGPDGFRTGWERLLEYFKTSMGPDKIVSGTGGGGYVPGTVSEQVIKTKSEAMGQVANQPPDVQAMRDAMPSWCGIFVFWALNKGGVPMPKWGLGGPAIKREAAYPPGHTPGTGDIAYRQDHSHYAIVENATGAGRDADVTTVNGNTAGEDNLGGQVQSHSHKLANWTGFFNPLVLMEGSLRGVEDPDAKPKSLRDLRRELFRVDRSEENDHEESAAGPDTSVVQTKSEGSAAGAAASAEPERRLDRSNEQEREEQEIEEQDWTPGVHRMVQRWSDATAAPSRAAEFRSPVSRAVGAAQPQSVAATGGLTQDGAPAPSAAMISNWHSARGPPIALQRTGEMVQRSWLGDAWDAVSGFASEAAQFIEEGLDAAKRWLLRKVRDFVREIPGYKLLSFILAEDPITGEQVERNGRNLLYAGLDILPAGGLFRTVIERIGVVDDIAAYLDARISDMTSLAAGIGDSFSRFWDSVSLDDIRDPEAVMNRVADLFHSTVEGITGFVTRAAVDFLDMIKKVMLREIVDFVRSQVPRLYPLLCVALGHDPVTNVEVPRNGTNILNALLEVSEEGREQRTQMQETGTFQKIAGFIDRGIAVFTTAYHQLRAAFSNIWDFITIDALVSPIETFNHIYDQFAAPVRLITDYIVDVAVEILRVIKEVLMTRLAAYARTVRGYPLVTVLIGSDPFTGQDVPRTMENIIHGFMSLMDGGEEQFQQMKESGAIDRTTARINAAVARLNMTPAYIIQLFTDLWHSFSLSDLAHPIAAFQRIMAKFGEPIGRLIAFVIEIVKIVVEVILQIMNFPLDLIGNIIAKTREAFQLIKADPIGFLKNLLRAIKQGFIQFFDNILKHLLGGLQGWLLSELKDANVKEPTDFSLKGILFWVLGIFNITLEHAMQLFWERLTLKIGAEKVAKIRAVIAKLSGAWNLIQDIQERGMDAIWERIQEKISNLWDTVLDSIKSWIMDQIINKIVTKLLSMLDPTGIMAVINSAIAIYKAIQSFLKYLREMLEIVNSFVEGVVEIASGNITRAADFLERTLARGVPIVIGFLANQVGLSGIGKMIGELIGKGRELVDQGMIWLIDKAINLGMSALNAVVAAGRAAVGAVMAWAQGLLGLEKPFTTPDNASHRLYYAQQGDTVKLMINPSPAGEYESKINEIHPPAAPNDRVEMPGPVSIPLKKNNAVVSTVAVQPDSDKKISMATLKAHALTVARHIDGLIDSRKRTSSDASQQAPVPGAAAGATEQTADFSASLDGLGQITAYLLSTSAAGPLPVTPVPTYGGLASGFATSMDVKPLTKLGTPGSAVAVDSPDYSALLLRRETPGGRSFYIAGHLLNNNVHGAGTTWQNLTPIAQKTNQNHESKVESKVKAAVEKDLILHYSVNVEYAIARKDKLIQDIEQTPNWNTNSVLSEKHQIIEAEAKLPTRFVCTLKQIKADGTDLASGDPGFDPAYNISGGAGTIDNESNVPQSNLDNYYLSSAAAVTYTDFATLKAEALAASAAGASATWEAFYQSPARKVSIDHLPDAQKEELHDCFRRQAMLNDEQDRVAKLTSRQSRESFEGSRAPYTGNILTDADKTNLRKQFDDRMTALRAAFLQTITSDVRNNVVDPNTRWGDYRNTWRLGANLSETDVQDFKTTVFDPRIAALKAAAPPTPP